MKIARLHERPEFYCLLFLAAALPGFFWAGLSQMFVLPKFLALYVSAFVLLGALALRFLLQAAPRIIGDKKTLVLVAAYAVVAVISAIISIHPATSLMGTYGRNDGVLANLSYVIIFFAASQIEWLRGGRQANLTKIISAAGAVIGLIGLLELANINLITNVARSDSRIQATFGNPTILGTFLAMVLIPIAVEAVVAFRERRRYACASWIASLTVASVALVFTATRGAWIGAFGGLIFLIWRAPRPEKRAIAFVAAVLVSVFLLAASITAGIDGEINIAARLKSLAHLDQGSAASRAEIWKIGLTALTDRPVFGHGPSTTLLVFPRYITKRYMGATAGVFSVEDNLHSLPLEIAVSMGLPALLIWILIVVRVFLVSAMKTEPLETSLRTMALTGSIIAFLISTAVNVASIEISALFWLFCGVVIGAGASYSEHSATAWRWPANSLKQRQLLIVPVVGLVGLAILAPRNLFLADRQDAQGRALVSSNPAQALAAFKSAADLYPYANEYWEGQGQILIQSRKNGNPNPDAEIAVYSGAIQSNPHRWINYIRLTNAHILAFRATNDVSHITAAQEASEKAFSLKAQNPINYYLRAVLLVETSREEAAEKALLSSLKIDPNYQEAKDLLRRLQKQ